MSEGIISTVVSQDIETKKVNINKLFADYWFRVPEYLPYSGKYVLASENKTVIVAGARRSRLTKKDDTTVAALSTSPHLA